MASETAAPVSLFAEPSVGGLDTFRLADNADRIVRTVRLNGHQAAASETECPPTAAAGDLKGAWLRAYMDGAVPAAAGGVTGSLRVADLFCGAGGLSLGVRQAASETGRSVVTEMAADTDPRALKVYEANHRTRLSVVAPIETLLDFGAGGNGNGRSGPRRGPVIADDRVRERVHGIDLVVAGPPCQGHSNLNNWTRRDDPRNGLLFAAAAFAVAAQAGAVIIENVPQAVHDRGRAVQAAVGLLESSGYSTTRGVLSAAAMGWPQNRRRFFLVACRGAAPAPLRDVARAVADRDGPRPSIWAIGGGQAETGDDLLDTPALITDENRARIDWLFDHGAYDLPDDLRPPSQSGGHTYPAMYGRMRPDRPAGTITTGFSSPGRGRHVHPDRTPDPHPGRSGPSARLPEELPVLARLRPTAVADRPLPLDRQRRAHAAGLRRGAVSARNRSGRPLSENALAGGVGVTLVEFDPAA